MPEGGGRIVEFGFIAEWLGEPYRYKSGAIQACVYSDGSRHWAFRRGELRSILPFRTALALAGVVYLGTKAGLKCATTGQGDFLGNALVKFIRLSVEYGIADSYEWKEYLAENGLKF